MAMASLRNFFALLAVAVGLAGCLGGEGGSSSGGSSGGSTTTTSAKPTVVLALASSLPVTSANTVTSVTFGTSIYAVATVKDANGAAVPNAVVSFAAANPMVVFTPASGSALTGSDGKASIKLDSASISDAGATSLTASADVTTTSSGTSTTATYTSAPLGVAVNASNVTLGGLTLGQSSISAYGTSVVSVPVLINGTATNSPIAVTFTSPCVTSGKATLSSPVTSAGGVATSTYRDNNCASGSDVITASVSGSSVSATIDVALAAANNVQFVSATPAVIGIQGAGSPLPQNSSVKFKVVDASNNGKPGVAVNFSLLQTPRSGGATLATSSATTDANGEVTATVTAGTIPTPVSVVATVSLSGGATATSQSNTLTITTGIPAQDFFSLSVQAFNIEGLDFDGITSQLFIIASDRMGNPVPDGTAVNFITEGGQIVPPSCTTSSGTCSVTFKSAQYKPADGRVTVLAYASGEKSFIDTNGNNVYDIGETFYDLGDPFIDANENGQWDASNAREQYLNFAPVTPPVACLTRYGDGSTGALPSNYASAPSVQNSCSGTWNGGRAYVRGSGLIVLSGSTPTLVPQSSAPATLASASPITYDMTAVPVASKCNFVLHFLLRDVNNNAMPAGTTVDVGTSTVGYNEPGFTTPATAMFTVGGTPVVNVAQTGGTALDLTVNAGTTSCTGVGAYQGGGLDLVVKTPQGVTTHIPVVIQN